MKVLKGMKEEFLSGSTLECSESQRGCPKQGLFSLHAAFIITPYCPTPIITVRAGGCVSRFIPCSCSQQTEQ